VASEGDSGKPRPAVVIQADWFGALSTVVVLPLTSRLQDALVTRIDVAPTDENGLKVPSRISVDRPQTARRTRLAPEIGRLDNDVMVALHGALAVFMGLA